MKDLVSVIIPVYNVSKYLNKCLESVINQTYNNLEIIIVDDGSTDSSGDICDSFAARDNRITVLHQPNHGVSNARNNGINIATGTYACIIDSDDYLDLNYVETLVMYAQRDNLDLVACGVYVAEKEDGTYEYIHESCSDDLLDNKETIKQLFLSSGFRGWGVNKLYSLDIIKNKNIRYHEDIKYCEDELFCLEYIVNVKKARFIKEPLYHYMLNLSSVNHLMYQQKVFNYRALDRLKADEICNEIVSSYNDRELLSIFNCRRFLSNKITLDKLFQNYNGDKDTLSLITKNLRKYLWFYITVEKTSIKRKLGALVLSVSPVLFYKISKCRKHNNI